MKSLRLIIATVIFLYAFNAALSASRPTAGFFLPDSVTEMTIKYRTMQNLMILSVTINDSVEVNLILDTGCRNLVLFGKRLMKRFKIGPGKPVIFSGLGNGRAVSGALSIGNKVSIDEVSGEQISIILVSNHHIFARYPKVDGIIGYDIFVKFEIEINPSEQTITFRPALRSAPPYGYTRVPMRIVDSRPILQSEVFVDKNVSRRLDLMIDTGSSLALLLKTTTIEDFDNHRNTIVLGFGLNGPVNGYQTTSQTLKLPGLALRNVPTGIVSSRWHNNASVGMEVLKDYVLILNYCKAYACFKRLEA